MAISKLPADDLFEKSSMSFGEHLEELRRCLAKSLLWLGIGTVVGLLFANQIVKFIETPLRKAISEFHVAQAKEQFLQANGEEAPEALATWMNTQGMMPEQVFIDPATVQLSLADAEAEVTDELPEAKEETKSPKPKKEESKKQGESKDENADSAEAASSIESSLSTELALGTPASEMNPWKGINLEQIQRLKPILIWTPIENKLISLSVVEGFMIWLKAGLVAGVVIGSPGIFFHVWQFIAAGLYPHERRYVYWYLPLSLTLFLSGVCLAFFVVFELVLGFLMKYSTGLDVEFTPRLNDYMSFALFLPLGFGIAFQLPIVMLGLHRFGVVSVAAFTAQWRIAVLAIAFLSMMLSPPDIYSMMGLFIPLVLLYFFGIFLCKYMPQGAGVGGPALDPEG